MNEERKLAYLDLIQQLLSCPSGEELNQILNNSLELVDEGFVLASQQVAAKLEEAGQENEAGFLRSLAQQVAQFLNGQAGGGEPGETQPNATPEDYASFLMELLRLEYESKSDRNVIYPFLARHQDKLDPTFGGMLVRWFRSELDPNDYQKNEALATLLNSLAIDIVEFPLGSRANNLEIAIACFQAALEVYTREAFPKDWAMTQNNLGNAYSDRIKGERGDNIEGAIACYQAALEVRTREAFPQNNAETLFNLGVAYRYASQLENARNTFAEAIDTVEEIRTGIVLGGEADRQKLAEEWQKLYRNTVEVSLKLEDSAAALEYAERSKARNLVELFAATRLKPEGVSPDVWEEYDRLYQQWWNLQQQGDGNASPSRLLGRLRQQIDQFIKTKITPHDPKFGFGQQVEPMRYWEIQALAEEGTAIVEWYFTSDGIQAFIVTGQGQQPIVLSTEGSALADLKELTREYLINYYSNELRLKLELPSCLQRLAEILELDKLISEIPSGCRELIASINIPGNFLQ
ncbi:MAG: tetratricopeptide repeat protein [Pseudomonadota bacterium]|nr:tetratricopeptide repeat protein [Pseudomonadota bacterium]